MNRANTEDWVECELGDVVEYSKGKKPERLVEIKSNQYSIPYINIKAFEQGLFTQYTDGKKCNLCKDRDLLMVWDGARAGFVGKALAGAIGSTLMKIAPKENIIKKRILILFFSFKIYFIKYKSTKCWHSHVEPSLLWNSKFKVAPLPIQNAIVKKIEELFSNLDSGISDL